MNTNNNNSYNIYANNNYNEGYCSSGCESGWTLYLDHSSISHGRTVNNPCFSNKFKGEDYQQESEQDEDLSMVSDASSGPPHFHEEEEQESYCTSYQFHNHDDAFLLRQKKKEKAPRRRKVKEPDHQSSLLDDTASSSLIQFSSTGTTTKKTSSFSQPPLMEEYSQGYSTTQFQMRPHEHHDDQHFDYFQPSLSAGNHWVEGKRW